MRAEPQDLGDFADVTPPASVQLGEVIATEGELMSTPSATADAPIPPQVYARRWKTLGVMSLALLTIGLDNTILNVALPSLQEEFDASTSTLQWIVDSYLLVFAGLLLTMGTLGDRFGRKLALQTGLALFGLASLAVLLVDSSGQLIAVRSLMGIGGALIMPATLSIITNVFPREERSKAIGIWAAMAAVGIGLGPLTGGLLLEWFDWTSVFLVNVPVTAVAFALAVVLVPESKDPKPGSFDFGGAALSIATLASLVYGLIEAPERGWTDPLILSCFGAAALLGAAFVRWELRVADPMLKLSFFRNPRFSVASMGISVAFFSLFGAIFATTQYLQDARGYSPLEAGAAMVPLAFGLVMGARSSVHVVARAGATRVVTPALLGLASLLAVTHLWSADMPYWPIGLWFFGVAFCMGWVMAPSTDSVMGAVPSEKSGVASAMNDVTRQVGGALGTAVMGSVISTIYASRIEDDVTSLSDSARVAAEDSVGQANAVAATLPESEGTRLADAAASAFTDALAVGFSVAAVCALIAAFAVKRWLPPRHLPVDAEVVELSEAPELEQRAA
jgi:EmrB/QacA subfamily drug resistance transporter